MNVSNYLSGVLWTALMLLAVNADANNGADDKPALKDDNAMEEVIVTGEWPGPQMWKISKDDHVVWMLGTLQPLPKGMVWKYRDVENVLAQSQQVIGRPNVTPKVSIFGMIPLYLQVRKVSKLPDDQTLKDVLPTELYQRLQALLVLHKIHDNDIEKLRPVVAAGRLYQEVIEANGLTGNNDVQETVFKLAKRHDVKVNDLKMKVDAPREILKEVNRVPVSADVACFEDVVASLETELPLLKKRAAFWAHGDVDALRKLVAPQERIKCREVILSIQRVKDISDRAKLVWFDAVTDSLKRYNCAMAFGPVYDLIGKDGVLDQLRAAGYQVEGP